ncbi:hypothetical protein [Microcystis phage Mel-JY01]
MNIYFALKLNWELGNRDIPVCCLMMGNGIVTHMDDPNESSHPIVISYENKDPKTKDEHPVYKEYRYPHGGKFPQQEWGTLALGHYNSQSECLQAIIYQNFKMEI